MNNKCSINNNNDHTKQDTFSLSKVFLMERFENLNNFPMHSSGIF